MRKMKSIGLITKICLMEAVKKLKQEKTKENHLKLAIEISEAVDDDKVIDRYLKYKGIKFRKYIGYGESRGTIRYVMEVWGAE